MLRLGLVLGLVLLLGLVLGFGLVLGLGLAVQSAVRLAPEASHTAPYGKTLPILYVSMQWPVEVG